MYLVYAADGKTGQKKMKSTTYGEMDHQKLPYGDLGEKKNRLRLENSNAYAQKGASRAIFFPLAKMEQHRITGVRQAVH